MVLWEGMMEMILGYAKLVRGGEKVSASSVSLLTNVVDCMRGLG